MITIIMAVLAIGGSIAAISVASITH
jgi:hypothetical protein